MQHTSFWKMNSIGSLERLQGLRHLQRATLNDKCAT